MSDGTGTTLKLNPTGKTSITFTQDGSTPSGAYNFTVVSSSIDLNEEQRRKWLTEINALGGRVVGNDPALVPLSFRVVIRANSLTNRALAAKVLTNAVMNRRGGTLQYNPEGLASFDTFFHYVASSPPRLIDSTENRYDSGEKPDNLFVLVMDVVLETQPLATSDIDNPAELADDTIDNWFDTGAAQSNQINISNTDLEGNCPSLFRMRCTAQSGQAVGRILLFRRSSEDGTLANLDVLYEAEDASVISPSVSWSEIADATRGGGSYMRCFPSSDANGVQQGLKFTLTNPRDLEGRFAVFGIGYDGANTTGVWTHQVKLTGVNVAQVGQADYFADSVENWQLIYAGEFELPLSPLSDLSTAYDSGPFIEWYSSRASGNSEFRLDAIILVFVSDSLGPEGEGTALDVQCGDGNGFAGTDALLIDNFPLYGRIIERAYVAGASPDYDLKRVLSIAPKGDFVELDPDFDHKIIVIQERDTDYVVFEDDFSTYVASRYLVINTMEDSAEWTPVSSTVTDDTTNFVEGDQSVQINSAGTNTAHSYSEQDYDFTNEGRFVSGDFFVFAVYLSDLSNVNYVQVTINTDGSNFYDYQWSTLSVGWNFLYAKRSDFGSIGSPDWADITRVDIYLILTTTVVRVASFDYLRTEKADPDNSSIPNPTGSTWDFQPSAGIWTIANDVSEDSPGAVLACLNNDTNEKLALYSTENYDDIRYRARVRVQQTSTNSKAGLAWRMQAASLTSGNEQGYTAFVIPNSDAVAITKFTSGVGSNIATASFSCDYDRWYTLGVTMKGTTFKAFATLSSTIGYDDDAVFDDDYELLLFGAKTDADYDTGKIGLISYESRARFDAVELKNLDDKLIPADEVNIYGEAVFRTITPFD